MFVVDLLYIFVEKFSRLLRYNEGYLLNLLTLLIFEAKDSVHSMKLLCINTSRKNDPNNMYIRVKCVQCVFWGDPVHTSDFHQEFTAGRMSSEEFASMIKMISTDCGQFNDLKCTYAALLIVMILMHLAFPHFLIHYQSASNSGYDVLPLALNLVVFAIFAVRIIKIATTIQRKIDRVLRIENCSKYIARGLCWRLDSNGDYLHLNLNYNRTLNQYLVNEVINNRGEEFDNESALIGVTNHDYVRLESESRQRKSLRQTFIFLGMSGGLFTAFEILYFGLKYR